MASNSSKGSSYKGYVATADIVAVSEGSYVGMDKLGGTYRFDKTRLPQAASLVEVTEIFSDEDNQKKHSSQSAEKFVKTYKNLTNFSKLDNLLLELSRVSQDMVGVIKAEDIGPGQVERVGGHEFSRGRKGFCVFVPKGRNLDELITSYSFLDKESERRWIALRFSQGESVTKFDGKEVELDKGGIEDFAKELERGVPELLERWKVEKKNHRRLQKEVNELREKRNDSAFQFEEQTRTLEAVDSELKDKQAELVDVKENSAKKEARLAELERQLSEARARHLQEGEYLALQELSTLEDEAEALHKARDVLKHIEAEKLVALHVALKLMPFTVLTGPSGSGKTSLLMGYAEALGMRHTLIPVQPNWTGVADLHGYVHPLWKRFVSTPFAQALARQVDEVDVIDLVILDEINLARVEYFLADYLSAFETRDRFVQIVPEDDAEAMKADAPDHKHPWLTRGKGRVSVPSSLLIAGTANEDHTTQTFSDKFRDRAAVLPIEMTIQPKFSDFQFGIEEPQIEPVGRVSKETWADWSNIHLANIETHKVLEKAKRCLTALANIGEKHGGFALSFRVWKDTKRFIEHALPLMKELGVPDAEDKVLDWALALRAVQKTAALPNSLFSHEDRENYLKRLDRFEVSEFKRVEKLLRRNSA